MPLQVIQKNLTNIKIVIDAYIMTKERLFGLLQLSLAHHPLCWQYRNHTINFFKVKLCLGCTGFYTGLLIGFLALIFSSIFSTLNWLQLVLLSTLFYLPTIFRITNIPFFKSSDKYFRLTFRFLLGVGVSTGILSIIVANNIFVQLIQIILGISLYGGLAIQRVRNKDMFKECETCSFQGPQHVLVSNLFILIKLT